VKGSGVCDCECMDNPFEGWGRGREEIYVGAVSLLARLSRPVRLSNPGTVQSFSRLAFKCDMSGRKGHVSHEESGKEQALLLTVSRMIRVHSQRHSGTGSSNERESVSVMDWTGIGLRGSTEAIRVGVHCPGFLLVCTISVSRPSVNHTQ
jgi:hypothetical protein